ncbi:MAG: type I restriction-modification system subunit M N-terminal domain-containing protein [Isosphaeraceae bacterium]
MAKTNANLIWRIADPQRGPYQPNQHGDVILPFTILRRLDCILEPTKEQVLAEYKKIQSMKVDPGVLLKSKFRLPFYNTSRWNFALLIGDPEGVASRRSIKQLPTTMMPS